MFKLIRRLAMLAVLLVVGGAIALAYSLDGLVQKGIQHGGSYALGVPVTASSASVGIFSGNVGVSDLSVANPPGFTTDPFFAMKKLATTIPVKDLLGDKIEIPKVELSGIRVSLEENLAGSNWSAIMENLKKFQTTGKKEETSGGGKRFIIKDLVISDVTVGCALCPPAPLPPVKKEITLPPIHLHDVGAEGGQGAMIGEIADLVVRTVLENVASQGGGVLPASTVSDLTGRVNGIIQNANVKGLDSKAIKSLAEDPSKTIKGLSDMLGGRKK